MVLAADANPIFQPKGLNTLFCWYIGHNNGEYSIMGDKMLSVTTPLENG